MLPAGSVPADDAHVLGVGEGVGGGQGGRGRLEAHQGGGGRVPHPYHAYNSAYNPVSRQDSELQSLSSDAHTTDDNMSSFTESSSHYSNQYRLVFSL